MTLSLRVECAAGCGLLAEALSSDPPTTPKPRNWRGPYGDGEWTRWDELDSLAEKHARKGHSTTVHTVSAVSREGAA